MNTLLKSTLLFCATFMLASATVVLITPTGETNVSGVSEFFDANNMVDNSGLSGAATLANYATITHAGASGTTAWTTIDPAPGGGDYYADGGTAAIFDMTLGATYALTDLVFWGYHFGNANGNEAREFSLSFSTDGGTTFPTSTTVSLDLGSHTVGNAATLDLGGTFSADTVRVNFTDNQFGALAAGGDRIGVGELKFIGDDAIPEPSSALLLSLAGLSLLRRRR